MVTESKMKTNKDHIKKLDQIKIQPYKEEGHFIRAAALRSGMSLQAYILEAVREKMEAEKNGTIPTANKENVTMPSEVKEAWEQAVCDYKLDLSKGEEQAVKVLLAVNQDLWKHCGRRLRENKANEMSLETILAQGLQAFSCGAVSTVVLPVRNIEEMRSKRALEARGSANNQDVTEILWEIIAEAL